MVHKIILALFVLWAQQTTQVQTGAPAPWLHGTGAPSASYTCNSSYLNIAYYQDGAPAGSRIWMCNGTAWIPTSVGTPINQIGLSTGMSAQTVCAASACPVGLYRIDISVVVTTGAALGSLTAASLAFTDEGGAGTVSLTNCATLSLLSVGNRCSASYVFYKASATTTVTLATTLGTVTGTPAYNVRAILVQEN